MNILKLYKHGQFHQVIIYSSLCVEDVDYICLCLSLIGIGRQGEAIILLRARAEATTDPRLKICILSCLYEITGIHEFSLEVEYWKILSGFDDKLYQRLKPIPRCPDEQSLDMMMKFLHYGAYFQPYSYSFTCLSDEQVALDLVRASENTQWLLQIVGDGGSAIIATKTLRRPGITSAFLDLGRYLDLEEAVAQLMESLSTSVELVRRVSALACYHHFLRHSSHALAYATRSIHFINAIRMRCGFAGLHGILDFEKETIVMIASQHLTLNTNAEFVESLLHELMNPEMVNEQVSAGSSDLGESDDFHAITRATSLRQSLFFGSCGNIYRVMAHQTSKQLTFVHSGKRHTGVVLRRDDALETARKYVLSAALQPPDNPFLSLYCDRVIWCLLLAGGVDLRILWFFITIRNHYATKLFLALVENDPQFLPYMWPQYDNMPEIIENVLDMCTDNLSKVPEGVNYLLPTAIECDDHLVILKLYIPEPQISQLDELHDTDISSMQFHADVSPVDLIGLVVSSEDIAEIWCSTYQNAHGIIPGEIRHAMKTLGI